MGVERILVSVELTADEIAAVTAPWSGQGFAALVYGRPEGMTIEHCVLSAAFDREPTTCRDLCVQKHPNVELMDPAGYRFAVATDSACRNRLLHSRPIEGSEFIPHLWSAGLRAYHLVFNTPGDPIAELVAGYAAALRSLAARRSPRSRCNARDRRWCIHPRAFRPRRVIGPGDWLAHVPPHPATSVADR